MRPTLAAFSLLVAASALAQDAIPLQLSDPGDAVRRLVEVQPFAVAEGTVTYDFTASPRALRKGQVVIVQVDPAFAQPRDARMPVLFAGTTPVQIVAVDVPTGCVVGLLPADTDLTTAPLFYGSTELPERIDAARGQAERDLAVAAGLRARPTAELTAARSATTLRPAQSDALIDDLRARTGRCSR